MKCRPGRWEQAAASSGQHSKVTGAACCEPPKHRLLFELFSIISLNWSVVLSCVIKVVQRYSSNQGDGEQVKFVAESNRGLSFQLSHRGV